MGVSLGVVGASDAEGEDADGELAPESKSAPDEGPRDVELRRVPLPLPLDETLARSCEECRVIADEEVDDLRVTAAAAVLVVGVVIFADGDVDGDSDASLAGTSADGSGK